jgi:predicted ATPase
LRGFLAEREAGQAAALPWYRASLASYQACSDLRDDVQGNLVFLNRVLNCSCVYYRDVVQGIISDTVQAQSAEVQP